MHEKFQQIMMLAFYQHAKAIHISGNGAVMFETGNRFKCKKMKMMCVYTKIEVVQLIAYIKNMSNIKSYAIEPIVHRINIAGHSLQVQICCIPSMYCECVVLRIVKSSTVKMKNPSIKNKYII